MTKAPLGADDDEVERLRAQVADLTAQLDDSESKAESRLRWRQRAVGALVALTCLLLFVSLVAVWAQRTVYNTDRWVAVVEDLPSNPAVAETLADRLTDEIVTLTNPEERIREALPDDAAILAGPITTALESLVSDAIARVIESDEFRTVWIAINRFAHDQIVAVLDGDSDVVNVNDGRVTLNLLPLVGEALALIPAGLFGDGTAPEIPADLPVEDAIRQISGYLGVTVPPDFGQVTVFEDDRLAAVQTGISLFNRLVIAIVVATVLFGALAIALSRRRRRTVLQLGLGAVVAVAASWALARAIGNQVVASLDGARAQEIANDVFSTLIASLRSTTLAALIVGALAAAIAFLLGDSRPARWTQAQVRTISANTAAAAARTSQGASAASWTAHNEIGLRVGGVVAALAILLLVHVSWAWLITLAAVLAVWQLGISGLAHLAKR